MATEQLSEIKGQEQKPSLFQQVKEGLLTDPKVFFAGEILHSPYGTGWIEAVDIIVSPTNPIYDADRLNEFMDHLLPELPRSSRDAARKHDKESDFQLGKLYFDETLGTIKREIRITTTTVEPKVLERAGVQIGESYEMEKELLRRRTWVRVYPDTTSAQLVAEYERGIKEGITEPNSTFDYMHHWFSAEQFEKIKSAGIRSNTGFRKLLRGRQ